MTTVVTLASARAQRAAFAAQELIQALSVQFNGALPVDNEGRVDAEFAALFQPKADALGLDLDMATLNVNQFRAVCEVMSTWSFLVRRHIGLQEPPARDEMTAYLQAAASGKPRSVPMASELRRTLADALDDKG